ncbi:restriction endonuclease subunit S, partial [Escherichia coli]
MSCRYLKIEDFCSTGSGGTPSRSKPEYYEGGDIPWIKSGDLKDSKIYEANEYITAAGLENSSAKIVEKDSILIAMYGATVGRLAILGINAATNQAICNIRPDTTIADMKYLYYFLKSKFSYFVENAVGGAQPNISQGLIKSLEVPLPSLDEQKRIADILDKAAGVCQKREQAIKLADDFLRAKFLEMFGTPANNIHRFPKGTIRDLVDSVNYGTSAKASIDSGEYPILRMGNITYQGRWDFTDLKYLDLSVKEKDKYLVKEGDLLFNRTNSKELVGKTAVYEEDRPMAFAGYLIRVRPNSIGNNYYISGYLNSIHGKITLMNMCKSIVGMANINAQELQNIEILIPPKHLQDEYEIIYKKIKKGLSIYDKSAMQLQLLAS